MRTIKIGRNPDNDIVFNVPTVSGNHAVINISDDGQIVISDFSTNGTCINGNMLHNASAQVTCMDLIIFPGNIMLDWNSIFAQQPMPQLQQVQQAQNGYQVNLNVYQQQNNAQQSCDNSAASPKLRTGGNKKMFTALFSFDGRIRRLEWGLTALIMNIGVTIVCALIALICFGPAFFSAIGGSGLDSVAAVGAGAIIAIILYIAVFVVTMWISLAQNTKRCHDLDQSGWLQLVFLVPFIGWIFTIWLLFVDGTPGPNRYGDSPKM